MELENTIKNRRSIRRYKKTSIPRQDLEDLVRLALLAPSPNNQHNWKLVVVQAPEKLAAMAAAVEQTLIKQIKQSHSDTIKKVLHFSTFFQEAPAVFTVWMRPYQAVIDEILDHEQLSHADINRMRGYPDVQSIGALIQTLMLAAVAKGYGTCWMTSSVIAGQEIQKLLGVDNKFSLVAIVPIGIPDQKPPERLAVNLTDYLEFID